MNSLEALCVLLFAHQSLGFLEQPSNFGDPGQCVWYEECGKGFNGGKLNCPAPPSARNAPRLTDPASLQIIKDYCPSLYAGDDNTHTCCSPDQIHTFKNSLSVPISLLHGCPVCLRNFLNTICQLTCSPHQSRFMWANMSAPYPDDVVNSTGIPEVTLQMSNKFANDLYDSCKDVNGVFFVKALTFLCGRPVSQCSPQAWFGFLGSLGNGQSPFPIKYTISDQPWTAPDGSVIEPFNTQNPGCHEVLRPEQTSPVIGNHPCACSDCGLACNTSVLIPRPGLASRTTYLDSVFGAGKYTTAEVIIERADDMTPLIHNLPPPSAEQVTFTSIFDKDFMKQAHGGVTHAVPFSNICAHVQGSSSCVVHSVAQYFQNNDSKVDKIIYDSFGFYVEGDYLDHFMSCSRQPDLKVDATKLHMSCESTFGQPTQPYIVLEGYNGNDNTYTCCSTEQLITMQSSLGVPNNLLQRCPACYHNFLNQICQMTCSPHQSKFIAVNDDVTCPDANPNCKTGKGVPSIYYLMTNKYVDDFYDSCKDVQMPSSNDKAMSILCGRPAKDCTPSTWMAYMGSTGNGQAPFPIIYNFTDKAVVYKNETYNPLNMTNVRCNETVTNDTQACSCQDCQVSCAPLPPPPAPKKQWKIFSIDAISFIMGCIFAAFFLSFGIYVICFTIIKEHGLCSGKKYSVGNSDGESSSSQTNIVMSMVSPADISTLEKLGARVEDILRKIFTVWGTWCAQYPIPVLLITIIVFGSLAGGIIRYNVTTDPVKLWSASTSTARVQKDYFDSHFGPFYRTEQVIITRPNNQGNNTPVIHDKPYPSTKTVLDLQTQIENITAPFRNGTVGLKDICFKPLAPDYEECTIESVLQFYQNNLTNLNKVAYDDSGFWTVADYLDHFTACTQAPASISDQTKLDMSCLGAYGGPAFPWVILGGYPGVEYKNATAFVITFVVNNHLKDEDNEMAKAWEKEFIAFMNYVGIPMTLIIIEVVPFLVLAVGVDNIFILVQTYQRDKRLPGETLEQQVGRAMTDMPAVREFALYAAMAVLFDFILQVTCFISLMTIDAKRQESNRFDMCCCLKLPKKEKEEKSEGYLYYLVNNYYSHGLLCSWVRPIVDSFVLDYFHNLSAYLSVGAPIYFVIPAGYNYTNMKSQNAICGSKGCNQDSLIGQVTSIAQPASSWMDDYFDWISAQGNPPCCRINNKTGEFCPSTSNEACHKCPLQPEQQGRPTPDDFIKYMPIVLRATYFMTYHTPMKVSGDYIMGLREARKIAKNISIAMNITDPEKEVFPYSVFYVFYEQYLTIVIMTIKNLGICMAAIFVVTFILLGFDFVSATIVCLTIIMIAIGISVEFCSHIARAFAVSIEHGRVLSGITLTKLVGISVLVMAKSQLFQVFYFRMYLGMVVFGASHGLIFLPVLLSYCGPSLNKEKVYQNQQRVLASSKSKVINGVDNRANSDFFGRNESPPNYDHL
ncbi:NPC1-like protein [Mya arenaria]|uniref:NPC1-like protein n=1 Tax=Mya arenaria TaxID=6604 RepID=A0ABY7F5Z1_MYAAR|nr:NPC1-like protein [Mya arenaria]